MSLPRGVSSSLSFGEMIAADGQRLSAAVAYWRKCYAALGETVLETKSFSSKAMSFAAALPDRPLADLTPEFKGLFDAADEHAMLSRSGCTMSTAELGAAVLDSTSADLAGELTFLSGLQSAALEVAQRPRAAKALRLAREVHDLALRYTICAANATDHSVPLSELLAIYRQEGAFGIAPARASWPHAPVIPTSAGGCRADSFLLWEGSTKRTSFVLSHLRASPVTPSENRPVSLSFGLAIRHLVIMCGLDTVLLPRLVLADELIAWYETIRRSAQGTFQQIDNLKSAVLSQLSRRPSVQGSVFARQRSLESQQDLFDALALGLAMSRLEESMPGTVPSEAELLDAIRDRMNGLIAAHPGFVEGPTVFLAPGDDADEAKRSLAIQASWYAGRRRIATLLAYRDRGAYSGQAALAPQLAYLRYNVGEFNFVRMLCRFVAKVDALRRPAARRTFHLSDPFVDALSKLAWSNADRTAAERFLTTWATDLASNSPLPRSAGWRHVGVLDAMAARGQVCCRPPAPPQWMVRACDTVRDLLTFYKDKNLFDVLALFVQSHPIGLTIGRLNVIGLLGDASLHPMRASFSFERLRRTYAKALGDAKLADTPP